MKVDRRDIFKFAGGAAVGVMFTPLPWKLLDDSAIWSQNWNWVPRPLKGEIKTKFSTCTLCPAGCGVKLRCVGEQPVSLAGVREHPNSRGALCPAGLGGHHLVYHPARLKQAQCNGAPCTPDAAALAVGGAIKSMKAAGSHESVAILDAQPGRAVSSVYRSFLEQAPNGVYVRPPFREGATLEQVALLVGQPTARFGIDLENTRTLLSFGAPLLDGWASPGRAMQSRAKWKLIQAETLQSRTALLADVWLSLKPGTEAALALGLAHVIVTQKLYAKNVPQAASDFKEYAAFLGSYTPERVSALTGIAPETIVKTAQALVDGAPTVALGGGTPAGGPLGREAEVAIAGLNLLLGSVGVAGGIVERREKVEQAAELAAVADHSIGVLIVDEAASGCSMPWPLVSRKLSDKALVVSLSPFLSSFARKASYVIPTPVYLETTQDVPSPFDAPAASFAISSPAYPARPGSIEASQWIAAVAGHAGMEALPQALDIARRHADEIHKAGRGELFAYADAQRKPVKDAGSPDEFWKALCEGACWVDVASSPESPRRFALMEKSPAAGSASPPVEGYPLALIPVGWRSGTAQASPLMTKLYQESELRDAANSIRVNPETAAACGVSQNCTALLETPAGALRGVVHEDAAVRPGVLEVAAGMGAEVLEIVRIQDDGAWRISSARLRRA